ncbi:NADH:flavin oxidoreductase/NADH oxidase [Mycolicibacterium thermoresistibile ATCC 19527]|uniref:NADH:flavin oxidoreductase/NADH oxidase n=2 Tax=Mycolicibacterium thermoresistibile TaxID=1797 RepID=G7CI74_MYCT3|nr:NADH:flavin oxidoreductase/NADH oxidase [Mycolicibacterium thermoresistibile ATCC 19527]
MCGRRRDEMVPMTDLSAPLRFAHGPTWRNRLALAPLTNMQSNADGTLHDDEHHWLVRRAEGGFAMVMTCAAHVSQAGQAFPGQLGVWHDRHLPGLTRLAAGIRAAGAVATVQLHHGGRRAEARLTGLPVVAPWDDPDKGVTALTTAQVEQVVQDFVDAAVRAEKAGFDGAEIHGAHGYLVAQFLDVRHNHRTDRYGGSPENRFRIVHEIIAGIRAATSPDFQLGLRLSPERYGIVLDEARALAGEVLADGQLDYLDLSLWDAFKEPYEEAHRGRRLIELFMDLPRGDTRVGVAGKITDAESARRCLDSGADFVLIGKAAIVHHDFARQVLADPAYRAAPLPVSAEHLAAEAVGPRFVDYLASNWDDFVSTG